MGITGKWCGRAEQDLGEDPSGCLGRWSYMTLKGKNSVTITIITAYRVSQVSMPQHGDGTTYHQQHMLMSKQGIKSPNPRGQFVTDIIIFINK